MKLLGRDTQIFTDENHFITNNNLLVKCEKNPLSGERIQIDSNGIPDHSAWALTGSTSTITEQSNSFRVPTVPVLSSIEAGILKV